MKIAFFNTKKYELNFFNNLESQHEVIYFEERLYELTKKLVDKSFDAVCCFVHDCLTAAVLEHLSACGIRLILLRSAGYNHVDIETAHRLNLPVVHVPAYSPSSIAEHAVALVLSLNRKIYLAYKRVRESNFSLNGLLGFDLNGKTVGVVGTGKIGQIFAGIMSGFGCRILGYDKFPTESGKKCGIQYVELNRLFEQSDIISLHCPLTPETHYLINDKAFEKMKTGVMLINTSRGAVVDTKAAISAIKTGKLGYLGLDVYEEEEHLFFEDLSDTIIQDDVIARLQTFPNVVITGHQAFFTKEAMSQIAAVTLANIDAFLKGDLTNAV